MRGRTSCPAAHGHAVARPSDALDRAFVSDGLPDPLHLTRSFRSPCEALPDPTPTPGRRRRRATRRVAPCRGRRVVAGRPETTWIAVVPGLPRHALAARCVGSCGIGVVRVRGSPPSNGRRHDRSAGLGRWPSEATRASLHVGRRAPPARRVSPTVRSTNRLAAAGAVRSRLHVGVRTGPAQLPRGGGRGDDLAVRLQRDRSETPRMPRSRRSRTPPASNEGSGDPFGFRRMTKRLRGIRRPRCGGFGPALVDPETSDLAVGLQGHVAAEVEGRAAVRRRSRPASDEARIDDAVCLDPGDARRCRGWVRLTV